MKTSSVRTNRRILIIDDTPSIHEDFRKILGPDSEDEQTLAGTEEALFGTQQPARLTFQLDSAYQGQEALELVQRAQAEGRPYAMAFTDMRMPPGWDGLETIEQLWKIDPHLQIALCTAYSDYSWEDMAERLEFGDQLLVLKKPFDSLEIRQMASALTWKWQMTQDAETKVQSLEQTIEARVHELLKVSHLLQYDVLTELPNSTLLGDRLNQSLALSRRHDKQLAVMFLGLDRFKRINNALGHPAGDEMLKRVGQSLVSTVRESDSVFRYGADEFVVILADIRHPQQTKGIAEKLLNAIGTTQHIAGHDLSVTASLGISIYPDDGFDAIALIKKAETAMRHVKESGPNDFRFFIEEMNQRARDQQTIESGIRLALERDEFVLHYQPKLDLGTGEVVGAEALIRWQKPGHGWVYPTDFIGVAEDSGLIVPLSKWVLAQACRQACAWQAAGLPRLCMSVNVSAIDFRQRGFVEGIEQVLKQTGLDPSLLELEITEGVLMQNVDATVTALNRIKAMGVRLAIDDFGTGYSSLSYLRRFPIDVLKIDQSFIRGLSRDINDAALVSAIISLGKSLKLTIIAEGVETLEQLDFLKAHQCEEGQGYYFSKAVAPDDFVHYLTSVKSPPPAAT
ncbi:MULTISPECIES: bifunctional diguanylate cyclase/phosphodiesterase [unclassified Pseudomonas]|uniref:putative bifunctional diguanylate cyclase/phosphodiesterase n=1 Tax=unclassified Pseudomonas TaxID=196821 RepID=UPI000C86B0AE|nr:MULTISPECIES: EAL domain-containing protein [unclassified Pseudomonas]MDF9879210.1 diguanylate cyclase (GGDEF)-like protein [Pseudomonas silensiensis]PMV85317.1 GGDEF domain-containing response regulator [Pseudomonas sp. GW101-1A09]PMV91675.1 GGDEF domain-containing response regulator [Pseudomonas sp. FW306-2-2C-B10A]PMV93424.1 GGDEF domain-containing response regulator [Pseudomonas sp. GW460-C8]PMW05552.1 GGDEF domain-containing response regulator [Pseudomonas sp. MPR-TSA4]